MKVVRPGQANAQRAFKQVTDGTTTRQARRPGIERVAFSLDEVEAATGLGRTTIYAEIRDGRLRATKVRGRTLVLADDLLRWLQATR